MGGRHRGRAAHGERGSAAASSTSPRCSRSVRAPAHGLCGLEGGGCPTHPADGARMGAHGIRVNALAPGYFETDLNRDFFQSRGRRGDDQAHPDGPRRRARRSRRARCCCCRMRRPISPAQCWRWMAGTSSARSNAENSPAATIAEAPGMRLRSKDRHPRLRVTRKRGSSCIRESGVGAARPMDPRVRGDDVGDGPRLPL